MAFFERLAVLPKPHIRWLFFEVLEPIPDLFGLQLFVGPRAAGGLALAAVERFVDIADWLGFGNPGVGSLGLDWFDLGWLGLGWLGPGIADQLDWLVADIAAASCLGLRAVDFDFEPLQYLEKTLRKQ